MCGEGKISPDGIATPGSGTLSRGWLMKTTEGGTQQWSTYTNTTRGNRFSSVTTSPSGEIYTCGFITLVIGTTYGSAQITLHNADGGFKNAVTLSEFPLMSNTSPSISNAVDWIPTAGNTPWDEGRRIYWSADGPIVATTTGLASDRAFSISCLTENLAVRWMTTHEKMNSNEGIFDIIPTADGILAVGTSAKLLGVQPNANNSTCGLLLKLPLEGKIDLNPSTRSIHSFLQPGVHDHGSNYAELQYYQPNYTGTQSVTFTTESLTTQPAAALLPLTFMTSTITHWIPLEKGSISSPMSYSQWASYHQLPPSSSAQTNDYDNDGRNNGSEWLFGGDPYTHDGGPAAIDYNISPLAQSFGLTRSYAAAGYSPLLETSTDISQWTPLATGILNATPLDTTKERLTFSLPAPLLTEPRRFYRVAVPR